MALTTQQQELADIAQAGEANACCLARGGTIFTDAMTGLESCGFGAQSFFTDPSLGGLGASQTFSTIEPLSGQCGAIQASLPSQSSPGQQQSNFGAGLGSFFTDLFDNAGDILEGVGSIVNPGTTTVITPGTTPTTGGGTGTQPKKDRTALIIVGVAVVAIVAFLLIRRKK